MRADRLARAASECVRQHERLAALCDRPDVEDPEFAGWMRVVEAANQLLGEAVAEYERAGASVRPEGDDLEWWHLANALWHQAREWLRRHERTDRDIARARRKHGTGELGTLAMDGALEASALFALRQALGAYAGRSGSDIG